MGNLKFLKSESRSGSPKSRNQRSWSPRPDPRLKGAGLPFSWSEWCLISGGSFSNPQKIINATIPSNWSRNWCFDSSTKIKKLSYSNAHKKLLNAWYIFDYRSRRVTKLSIKASNAELCVYRSKINYSYIMVFLSINAFGFASKEIAGKTVHDKIISFLRTKKNPLEKIPISRQRKQNERKLFDGWK